MIPAEFDYVAPDTLDEALTALRDGGEDAKLLAGGHSLIPLMKLRLAAPTLLVDLRKVGLDSVSRDNGTARFGAMVRHHAVATGGFGLASAAAISRSPPLPRATTEPSQASSTAGMSDAGSPWASVPPIVPMLRTCWSAIVAAAMLGSPKPPVATWWWRTIAPNRIVPFSRETSDSPGTRRRSTSSVGAASRSFISGISEWPPARSFASSPPSRSAEIASSSEAGAT